MLKQAAECSLTCLLSDRKTWIAQGIAQREGVIGLDLTAACRDWLNEHVGPGLWHWDWFWEEDETEIHFSRKQDAALFKLTWL